MDDAAEEVTFLLSANPGAPLLPLARVASGGELARTMLALRLVLDGEARSPTADGEPAGGASTMVFDEVDAGIGGTAASAVGAALARLAADRQVLVVTHLAQVAAWADAQVAVAKRQAEDTTASEARPLDGDERLEELARMLSGSPESPTARRHAAELLQRAAREASGPIARSPAGLG
jgi:DNA repair protein RecN (Recombination protein N)